MMKCSNCHVDSAMYRATVRVCPKCGALLDADELFRLFEKLKISKKSKTLIKKEIRARMFYYKVLLKSPKASSTH